MACLPRRLVLLGASNLTRGFAVVVRAATGAWGEPLEVFGALGHGRSYGMRSRVLVRTLPGILESGLWDALSARVSLPTRALVTDVGNDVLYGAPVETILGWVRECVARLGRLGAEVVLSELPMASVEAVSEARYRLVTTILVPSCRVTLEQARERARRLNSGLVALARAEGLTLASHRPEWYGLDPIHIRPRCWEPAWRAILFGGAGAPPSDGGRLWRTGALALYLARPDRRWLCGVEQRTPQPAITTRAGTTVWLY